MTTYTDSTCLPWHTAANASNTFDLSAKPKPTFAELPVKYGIRHAWDYFGRSDELGTINFLTPEVIKAAAAEIKDGTMVSLNLPVQLPTHPSYHRMTAQVEVATLAPPYNTIPVRDDLIHFNTQSGTQFDGLRHFGCIAGNVFYNDVPNEDIKVGKLAIENPLDIQNKDIILGVHNWATKGIQGRGVLIDMIAWYTRDGAPLGYDPWTTHAIPVADIKACAAYQGTTFSHGDHLIVRIGFMQRYYSSTQEEKAGLSGGNETFAGLDGSDEMAEWIWNTGFASVSSDQPALEAWPCPPGAKYLHETLLAGFGCPIGEFFETEKLAETCHAKGRFTFFFVSNLLNILGGCASTANASATF